MLSRRVTKHVGLRNTGTICFLNCVLQSLASVRSFHHFLNRKHPHHDLTHTLRKLSGGTPTFGSVDASPLLGLKNMPAEFVSTSGPLQHDAQELYTALLDSLHDILPATVSIVSPLTGLTRGSHLRFGFRRTRPNVDNGMSHLRQKAVLDVYKQHSGDNDPFLGQLASSIKCTNCDFCNVTYSDFISLSLYIPEKKGAVSLNDCLDSYSRSEEVPDFLCDKCQTRTSIHKRVLIGRSPKSLCLHFQRSVGAGLGKNKTPVKFPEHLELTPYMTKSHSSFFSTDPQRNSPPLEQRSRSSRPLRGGATASQNLKLSPLPRSDTMSPPPMNNSDYKLRAVVLHKGGGVERGHFITYRKALSSPTESKYNQWLKDKPSEEEWIECNDTYISQVSKQSVLKSKAYLLFYEKEEPAQSSAAAISSVATGKTTHRNVSAPRVTTGVASQFDFSQFDDFGINDSGSWSDRHF